MDFEIIGEIRHPETFARGTGIRELPRLHKIHGLGKGVSVKVLPDCPMDHCVKQKSTGVGLQASASARKINVILTHNHEQT
jgi:hypothetical protein